jgi:hypothetical protein
MNSLSGVYAYVRKDAVTNMNMLAVMLNTDIVSKHYQTGKIVRIVGKHPDGYIAEPYDIVHKEYSYLRTIKANEFILLQLIVG